MSAEPPENLALSESNEIAWSQHYATLAIRIQPVLKRSIMAPSPLITFTSGYGDFVTLSDFSISQTLAASPGDHLVVVHLSLKNLGSYIADDSGIGEEPYVVNSRVITLSAKVWNRGWLALSSSSRKLPPPVVHIHLQHNSDVFKKHVCAFWNSTNG